MPTNPPAVNQYTFQESELKKCPEIPARQGNEYPDLLKNHQQITDIYKECRTIHNSLVDNINKQRNVGK